MPGEVGPSSIEIRWREACFRYNCRYFSDIQYYLSSLQLLLCHHRHSTLSPKVSIAHTHRNECEWKRPYIDLSTLLFFMPSRQVITYPHKWSRIISFLVLHLYIFLFQRPRTTSRAHPPLFQASYRSLFLASYRSLFLASYRSLFLASYRSQTFTLLL